MSLLLRWLEFTLHDRPLFVFDDLGERHWVRESALASDTVEPDGELIDPDRLSRQGKAYLRLRRRAFSRRYHLFVSCAMVFLFVGSLCWAVMLRIAGFRMLSWVMLPISILPIVVAILNPGWMRRQAAWKSRILFGAGSTCYVCGYGLHQLVPAADGIVVCPECGAAWRLSGGRNSSTGGCET